MLSFPSLVRAGGGGADITTAVAPGCISIVLPSTEMIKRPSVTKLSPRMRRAGTWAKVEISSVYLSPPEVGRGAAEDPKTEAS
jgi:hypothetical protein